MILEKKLLALAAFALLLFALTGCNQGNIRDESESPVWILVSIPDQGTYNVVSFASIPVDDVLELTLFNYPVGVDSPQDILPNPPDFPDDTYLTIIIEHYTVTFHAKDGGSLEGVDVPPGFRIVTPNIRIDFLGDTNIETAVVPIQLKLQPPLNGASGDPLPIEAVATVTFFGHTLDGETVKGSTHINVDFWD